VAGGNLTVVELPAQLPGLLRHPGGGRVGGAAGQVDASRAELDEEQHVDGLEEQRLDREEVAGEDLVPVLAKELPPGAAPALPLGCRRQAVAPEHGAHGRVAEAMIELGELALDAPVAPAGVLPGQPEDQRLDLGGDGRAATRTVAPDRPLAADQ